MEEVWIGFIWLHVRMAIGYMLHGVMGTDKS